MRTTIVLLFGAALTALSLTAQAQNPPRPNTFLLYSVQAGSTTDIDNLRIVDLDTSQTIYANPFDTASEATNQLYLCYWPIGADGTTNCVVNGSMTRVADGKLRLETTGFGANGGGGYNSQSEAVFTGSLPHNFLVEFEATRLQWAGHFRFNLFHQQATDSASPYASGGAFSTNRSPALRLDVPWMGAAGSSFSPYGLLTNYGADAGWAVQFPPPGGSLMDTHRLGMALSNSVVSFYLDGALLNAMDIAAWTSDFCSPHRATAIAVLDSGGVGGATLTDAGCGYTNPPTVLIQGGGGSGATATAVVSSGQVSAITITSAGSSYTNSPRIVIASPPFEPTVSIAVSKVKVSQHVMLGRNYVLEASTDLVNWTATGPEFTADSETFVNEFDVDMTGRFFRIRQVP